MEVTLCPAPAVGPAQVIFTPWHPLGVGLPSVPWGEQDQGQCLVAARGPVPSPELADGHLVSWGRQEGRCPGLCLWGTRRLPDPVLAQGPPLFEDPVDVFGFSGFCQWPVCSWSWVAEGKG